MVRLAALVVAALAGLLIAGCAGGNFAQPGLSLPSGDGVQTVSDAADALDGHRALASENAKAAIGVTDALGSFVRAVSAGQRGLSRNARPSVGRQTVRLMKQSAVERNGKGVADGSALVVSRNDFCLSSAGYNVSGIASLDATFGWENGALSGGSRAGNLAGSAVWSAKASGAVVQGEIGSLSISRTTAATSCPMNAPAFILNGGTSNNAFSLPISMAFHHGVLSNLSVVDGRFASGDTLQVTTMVNHQPVQIDGIIDSGRTRVATFRTNAVGDGTLTITSTGAQYVIADWIVVGI